MKKQLQVKRKKRQITFENNANTYRLNKTKILTCDKMKLFSKIWNCMKNRLLIIENNRKQIHVEMQ